MNQTYSLHYPAKISFGVGISATLPEKLTGFRRILLAAGSHFMKTPEYSKLLDSLKNFEIRTISGIHPEPPLEDVDHLITAGRDFRAEAVIAVGGGSVIDCAKAAAALIPLNGFCADYFSGEKNIPGKGLFFAALPTTSGTGAEITNNAVLTDSATKIKKSLRHPAMTADHCPPPFLCAPRGLNRSAPLFPDCRKSFSRRQNSMHRWQPRLSGMCRTQKPEQRHPDRWQRSKIPDS